MIELKVIFYLFGTQMSSSFPEVEGRILEEQ